MHGYAKVLILMLALVAFPAPGEEGGQSHALAAPISMESGAYNPWTDRCSDSRAPVRRKMYLRQPAGDGPYPVFLYFIGTLRSAEHPTAKTIVDRAARRGFVAAAVDYDTIASVFRPTGVCDSIQAKARCTLSSDEANAPESAMGLICGNRRIDGREAGLKADCDLGIVVSGFSQGAALAMLARDYDVRVQAMWGIGFHDQGLIDKHPLTCMHGEDGHPPGGRALPTSRMRLIIGQEDKLLRRPLKPHLQDTTGRACSTALGPCFAVDGSGWGIVPNGECTQNCIHEYLDDARFWESDRWWGADRNIDWLKRFVQGPPPGRGPVAGPGAGQDGTVTALRRILADQRPAVWQCDDTATYLRVAGGVSAGSPEATEAAIRRVLAGWEPGASFDRIGYSVVRVTLSDDQQLAGAMGSAGARCYLGSLTATLTSLEGIDAVWLEIEEGSHAEPGLYTRASFLDMFDLSGD